MRAELDELEEQLTKQLAELRAERNELAVAERVLERVSQQLADERAVLIAVSCVNCPTAGSPHAGGRRRCRPEIRREPDREAPGGR
ncbi:hypothetical protein FNH09_09300 [Streptomyces adustus]|uniref:Uncharacterized protein n=1 Tax=Streptomyces adustus TaxID=1609272 RepID=A0A5N8VBX7_9ACTN|nr:hypothetical protein [Streptomyces adustus]